MVVLYFENTHRLLSYFLSQFGMSSHVEQSVRDENRHSLRSSHHECKALIKNGDIIALEEFVCDHQSQKVSLLGHLRVLPDLLSSLLDEIHDELSEISLVSIRFSLSFGQDPSVEALEQQPHWVQSFFDSSGRNYPQELATSD